jgi:hypothetical protein
MGQSRFNLVSLAVIVVLLGLLISVLFPAVSASRLYSSSTSIGSRGKDIYVAIIAANTEREPLGLGSVWPKSNPPTNKIDDISQMNFTNSTDYFTALYDGGDAGTDQHDPYVRGFDYSKLAGAGVPAKAGAGRLRPANNMWTIAKNVREDMEEIIPVLVTRNLAAESLVTDLPTMLNRRLCFDEEWKTPFGKKGFVVVRKGGGIFNIKGKYAKVSVLYGNQTFLTTIPGSKLPSLCYLTPNKEVIPSEAGYQAWAATNGHSKKGAFYDWWEDVKELFETLKYPLFLMLLSALMSAAFIFVIVFFDKKWRPELSVMSWVYWLLLWGTVTAYLCCPIMSFNDFDHSSSGRFMFPPVLAFAVHFLGILYMIGWRETRENTVAFKLALGLILAAPLLALLCFLVIIFVILPPAGACYYLLFLRT